MRQANPASLMAASVLAVDLHNGMFFLRCLKSHTTSTWSVLVWASPILTPDGRNGMDVGVNEPPRGCVSPLSPTADAMFPRSAPSPVPAEG